MNSKRSPKDIGRPMRGIEKFARRFKIPATICGVHVTKEDGWSNEKGGEKGMGVDC